MPVAAGNHDHRFEITRTLSDVQARIDHAQNMLTLHARPGVTAAYNAYIDAAKTEAGGQMHDAWKLPGINDDVDVNLHFAYPREKSDRLRVHVLAVVQADLAIRALKPWTWGTYWQSVRAARAAARPPADPAPVVGGSEAAGTPERLDTNTADTDPKAPTDPLH